MSKDRLKPEHRKARLIRALSGLTQEEMSRGTGIPASLIDHFEQGNVVPGGDHLEMMAACAGITTADADEHLRLHRTQCETWLRRSEGLGAVLDHLARRLNRHCAGASGRQAPILKACSIPAGCSTWKGLYAGTRDGSRRPWIA